MQRHLYTHQHHVLFHSLSNAAGGVIGLWLTPLLLEATGLRTTLFCTAAVGVGWALAGWGLLQATAWKQGRGQGSATAAQGHRRAKDELEGMQGKGQEAVLQGQQGPGEPAATTTQQMQHQQHQQHQQAQVPPWAAPQWLQVGAAF